MTRPVGVAIVAILNFIGAFFLTLGAIALFLGGNILGAMLSSGKDPRIATMLAGMGAAFGMFCLIIAAGLAFLGYGNWTLRPWARIVTIVLAVIALVGGSLTLFTAAIHVNVGQLVGGLVKLSYHAVVIWYYVQPEVKRAFGAG